MFALPADLRNYFKGVGTAPDGAYLDTTVQRPLKLNRQGFMEDRDPFLLRDKQGEPILCFCCGQSALPREAVTVRVGESIEMAERRAAFEAAGGYQYPASQTPWQEFQRAMIGELETGAVLEPAVKYHRIVDTLGLPRDNH